MVQRAKKQTPYQDELRKFYGDDPGRRDSIAPTGSQALMSLAVAEALGNHAMEVFEATENIILESQRRAEAMRKETDKVVGAMYGHKEALTAAARGSEKYAKGLLLATIALVAATLALVWATLRLH